MAKSNVTPISAARHSATTSETAAFDELILNPIDYGIEFRNPRRTFSKADVRTLAEDIANVGVKNPLQVWRTKDKDGKERLVVMGGQRRYLALELLRKGKIKAALPKNFFDEVPVRVTEGLTAADARIRAFRDNSDHEQVSDYDETVALADIIELEDINQKEACKRLGKSTTWASRRLKAYRNACEPLKKAWKAGKVPFDDVKDLAEYEPDEQPKRVQKYLDTREKNGDGGDRKSKADAKKTIDKKKKATPKAERVKPDVLREMAQMTEGVKDDYLRGIHDMAKFALGELPMGKLDKAWKDHAASLAKSDRD